ncbi:MAG: pyridoxamine 5'-phosphate oxidase family protein, partial [Planctomycetota bacterium]
MDLREYFETAEGTGILSTADSDGNVDLAIYARPHMVDDETIVLVMSDKLSHTNLQTNPKA